jgi:hypothetical protein
MTEEEPRRYLEHALAEFEDGIVVDADVVDVVEKKLDGPMLFPWVAAVGAAEVVAATAEDQTPHI